MAPVVCTAQQLLDMAREVERAIRRLVDDHPGSCAPTVVGLHCRGRVRHHSAIGVVMRLSGLMRKSARDVNADRADLELHQPTSIIVGIVARQSVDPVSEEDLHVTMRLVLA